VTRNDAWAPREPNGGGAAGGAGESGDAGALDPYVFSHTFDAQIGGQRRAGFVLCDFYEDGQSGRLTSKYFPVAFATRARKTALRAGVAGA